MILPIIIALVLIVTIVVFSCLVANAKPPPDPGEEFDAEYEKFVQSMLPYCHCEEHYRPCDGVLAGGICDDIHDEPDRGQPPEFYDFND